MSDSVVTNIVRVLLGVTALAIVAVLVSQKSATPGVTQSFGTAIKRIICQAVAPVTGASCGSLAENVTSTITFGNVPTGGG